MQRIKAIILLLCLTVCHSRKNGSENGGKIIGGRLAKQGEFPYVVSFSSPYICTGALISYKQIMTSGRCFYDFNNKMVKFWSRIDVIGGSLEIGALNTPPTDPKAQVRKLSSVAFARGFNERENMDGIKYHDLAFALVNKPFEKSDTLSLAPLPGRTADEVECKWHELAKRGTLQCFVVGWGTTRLSEHHHPDLPSKFLKVAEVKAWTDCKCKDDLVKARQSDGTLHGEVCLEPVRKGEHTCRGDRGATIICGGFVFGVVSTTHCYVDDDYSDHRKMLDKQYGVLMWNYFDNVELPRIKSNSFRIHLHLFSLPIASLFFLI